MQACFLANEDRPFHVGYGPSTTLPARDGVPHGTIQRSAKAPNNSFFKHWTSPDDCITWDVQVGRTDDYDVIVYYTCAAGNEEDYLAAGNGRRGIRYGARRRSVRSAAVRQEQGASWPTRSTLSKISSRCGWVSCIWRRAAER